MCLHFPLRLSRERFVLCFGTPCVDAQPEIETRFCLVQVRYENPGSVEFSSRLIDVIQMEFFGMNHALWRIAWQFEVQHFASPRLSFSRNFFRYMRAEDLSPQTHYFCHLPRRLHCTKAEKRERQTSDRLIHVCASLILRRTNTNAGRRASVQTPAWVSIVTREKIRISLHHRLSEVL